MPAKKYNAPALEKGLDIIELLATRTRPISQTQIAQQLGRSISEVFRMLSCLEERGYITRSDDGEGFALTLRLHHLAHNWPPSKQLLEVALPEMRHLAEQTSQSCHLGLYNSGQLYVAAQAESPLPVMISVKVTANFPLLHTASGRVLLAFQSDKMTSHWLQASHVDQLSEKEFLQLNRRLASIREQGFEFAKSDRIDGLSDISCPILDVQGNAIAAITVPYLTLLNQNTPIEEVKRALKASAEVITQRMGNSQPEPVAPAIARLQG